MSETRSLTAEVVWSTDLRFGATSGTTAIVIDGDSTAGPSPPQLLVMSLAACMAMDVVDIVRKGRHELSAFRTAVTAERNREPPRRLLKVEVSDQLVTDRVINELMGKDASARFRFIMERAEEAQELDV